MNIFTVTLNTAIDVVISEEDYNNMAEDSAMFEKAELIPAGKGINVSRALKSAGIPSTAIAFVGEEDMDLFSQVEDELISAKFIPVKGYTRRNITISNCSDGQEHHERTIGYSLTEEDMKTIFDVLCNLVNEGDWILFSGSLPCGIPTNTYKELIDFCKKKGAFTGLDSSGAALKCGILASPYFIKPNKEELEDIKGSPLSDMDEITNCLRKIASTYDIPLILTTLSGDGAVLYSYEKDCMLESEALPVRGTCVSSVGCGDSCVAGFMSGLLEHHTYDECLKEAMIFANANLYTKVPGDLLWDAD